MTTVVTGKRQLTVPIDIARELGIESGTRVEWKRTREPNQVVLTVQPNRRQLLERVQEIGRKYQNKGEGSARILERLREKEERERTDELDAFAKGTVARMHRGGGKM